MLGHAFERLGLHRVGLTVFSYNLRAIRAYEKAGFRIEGRLREAIQRDGATSTRSRWASSPGSGSPRTTAGTAPALHSYRGRRDRSLADEQHRPCGGGRAA